MQESDNVQHLIFALLICPVVTLGRLKTKESFKLLSLKVVTVTYERCSHMRGSKYMYSDLTWKLIWYFGKLVTEERKSLMRGGPNWRFHCVVRPMAMQGSVSQQGWIPPEGSYIIYLE